MSTSPTRIERSVRIALYSSFPFAIAIGAWALMFMQLADITHLGFNDETLNIIPMGYVGACSTLTFIAVLLGMRGLFFRIVQIVVGGTLLLLFAAVIITGIERFTIYVWTGEYIVAALFYMVIFTVLWLCLRYRKRLRDTMGNGE